MAYGHKVMAYGIEVTGIRACMSLLTQVSSHPESMTALTGHPSKTISTYDSGENSNFLIKLSDDLT